MKDCTIRRHRSSIRIMAGMLAWTLFAGSALTVYADEAEPAQASEQNWGV